MCSATRSPSDALDHEVRREVHGPRDNHQKATDEEQHLVVRPTFDRLPELCGDRGRQRPDRVQYAVRNLDGVPSRHQHRHRFSDRASDAEQARREKSILRGREQDPMDDLPTTGAEGYRCLPVGVGYGLEGTLTDLRSSRIIREEIAPRFKAGDIAAGLRAGTEAILGTIEGTYEAEDDFRRLTPVSGALHYVVIAIVIGFLAGLVLSQGLRRARALLGAVLSFMVAQAASIAWGIVAAGVTAVLLWMVLGTAGSRRSRRGFDDWAWYSGGGWSGGGSFGNGGFSGGGGDFGGGGASGDW